MAKQPNAAKVPNAGKIKGTNQNKVITAEIGKVWLSLKRINGTFLVEFSTDCVDDGVTILLDYAADEHGVALEPELMFSDCEGFTATEVDCKAFEAIRKWISKNTNWHFRNGRF